MNFESLFDKLLNFYKVKTVTDLADKLNVTRSTVQGWKNRQAIGTVLEFLFINEPSALIYIFSSNSKSQHLGSITNSNIANDVQNQNYGTNQNYTETDEGTYFLYKEAYKKANNKQENINKLRNYLMDFKI
ncbi:helix-turn-helix domain-containing protein [Aliarcobacter butzleri]|uniref:helix-turn-helix domain-containing protein n=1 Tax=Aliarcobacter butzleri TaxID=28197 RepID=UPI002B24A7DA|nr:helix-turn-helix domain-containing protein [Aliarcobacter butzleri]